MATVATVTAVCATARLPIRSRATSTSAYNTGIASVTAARSGAIDETRGIVQAISTITAAGPRTSVAACAATAPSARVATGTARATGRTRVTT